jgi:hypothetical protein
LSRSAKKIPFEFILDYLVQLNPVVKPMFGAYAIYIGDKIMLILRDSDSHTESNGVWIATEAEYHSGLRNEIPGLISIDVLSEGKGETNWQMISKYSDDFEASAIKICDMINRKDIRIGRVPQKKKKRAKK